MPKERNDKKKKTKERVHRVVDPITHVLERSDVYIGSKEENEREVYILKEGEDKCEKITSSVSTGFHQVAIMEALANATDAVSESIQNGYEDVKITIEMNREWMSVKNEGIIVPVKKFVNDEGEVQDAYVPQIVFGQMLSSSNYDDIAGEEEDEMKSQAGRFGMGIKCTNIFSTEFNVHVLDPQNKKEYKQKFSGNMREIEEPVIERYKGKEASITIRYKLDFERFGYKRYPKECIDMYRRLCMDASYNSGVIIIFNEQRFEIPPWDIRGHGSYYFPFDLTTENSIIYYKWREGVSFKKKRTHEESDDDSLPTLRVLAVDTPNKSLSLGYTNGLHNIDGGEHVKYAMKGVGDSVIATVNQGRKRRVTATTKGRGGKAGVTKAPVKTNATQKLTISDLRKHLSIIVSIWVRTPTYTSQTKTCLSGCKDKAKTLVVTPEPKLLNAVLKWDFVETLRREFQVKNMKKMNVREKGTYLGNGKHEPANDAGKGWPRAKGTILCLTEGNSASGYVTALITKSGRDKLGNLALKGKPINALTATDVQLYGSENKKGNAEIRSIVKASGLTYGMDYSIKKNYQTLNYDAVMVMTDQDPDGDHIKGLLLVFFYKFWPSLFTRKRCYFMFWRSPLYRAIRGENHLRFYDDKSFKEWAEEHSEELTKKLWEIKFCKGLGSSSREQVRSDYDCPQQVALLDDDEEESKDALQKGYGGKTGKSDIRKVWLTEHHISKKDRLRPFEEEHVRGINKEYAEFFFKTIRGFVDTDHFTFSTFNVTRNIPCSTDGLKPSERKIVMAGLKYFNYGSVKKVINIAAFSGNVIQHYAYHHGEQSLHSSCGLFATTHVSINMNNLPIFRAESIIGDRNRGNGAISAARYANILLGEWAKHCFHKIDMQILPYNYDNGDRIEPQFLVPVIPLHLANGVRGIGTGWSTDILNYSPADIIEHLSWKLERKKSGKKYKSAKEITTEDLDAHRGPAIRPYYHGFLGKLKIVNKPDRSNDIVLRVRSRGCYDYDKEENTIHITELHVDMIISGYREVIEEMITAKMIKGFVDQSGDFKVDLLLTGVKKENFPGKKINYQTLKLEAFKSLSNMNMMHEGVCKKYESAYEIIDDFFEVRIGWYEKRKEYILKGILDEIILNTDKARFLRAVLREYFRRNPKLIPKEASEEEIEAILAVEPIMTMMVGERDVFDQMDQYEPPIPHDIYHKLLHRNFNINKLRELEAEIIKLQEKYDKITAITTEEFWQEDLDGLKAALEKEGLIKE